MNPYETYSNYFTASGMLHGSMKNIMGTLFDLLVFGNDSILLHKVWEDISAEIIRLHKMLNRFDPLSEISSINRQAYEQEVKISEELMDILLDCKVYYKKTKGYFDITLRDYSMVTCDKQSSVVSFSSPDIEIDLGGYAKGYTLKRIKTILGFYGIEKAFINFGNSSVFTLGNHPHGNCWSVGIVNPYNPAITLKKILLRNNESLSVSGNSPQREKHIKNPLNNSFNEEKKLISVIAPDPIEAEVLSTTLFVCMPNEAESIMSEFHIYETDKINAF